MSTRRRSRHVPWTPTPEAPTPADLAGTEPFYAFTLEGDGSMFTIWVEETARRERLFVSERDEAVHVVRVTSNLDHPVLPVPDDAMEIHDGWAGIEIPEPTPFTVGGWLAAPLGTRTLVDASRGRPVDPCDRPPSLGALRRRVERAGHGLP